MSDETKDPEAPTGFVNTSADKRKAAGETADAGGGEESDAKTGKLPEDFPGHAALAEAGINTYGQLRKAGELTEIAGIGEATAAKIAEALGE